MENVPFKNIDNPDLTAMMADGQPLQLVDVRTTEEHRMLGYIPGAMLLPLHELPLRWDTLNPEVRTVVTCEHGVRSVDACFFLARLGFKQLHNLTYGMATWDGPREPLQQAL
jgi:rhodanese-related sulfurtransferase